ncbi:type VI secretion system baseplate subunit TssG [Massilia sp. CCM 9210]|uniref:type VI secretion system baseplate subunit TssG n=1 Tax=Massilia scottii TaxID=3057166 RepID=UPI002796DCD1|nr:type VI secretion system baseplate subunit TssG [Massilia sp. CCM 9210]MDQ1812068.1 type VI secretion system baseplate subunit TssG [Massilia sp. CCM 9210]
MATHERRTPHPLIDTIAEHYGSFNVFQLLRLLQWQRRSALPERQLRFRAALSGAFPGREVSGMRWRRAAPGSAAADIVDIATPNYCVASALGPLPEPYLDWMRDLRRMREHAMPDFLDLFNQRLHVLRHALKARQTIGLNHQHPKDTPQAFYLASLIGMGQAALVQQLPVPERAWLGIAGLLANRRRNATTVGHVLGLFLGVPAAVEQLAGAWQHIEAEDRIALGQRNHRLGVHSPLGARVWDQAARIRVRIAPLPYERFCSLLPADGAHPPGAAFEPFAALLGLLLDGACDCQVQLRLRADGMARSSLRTGAGERGLRLGRTAWLSTAPAPAGDSAKDSCVHYVVRAFEHGQARGAA